MGEFVQGPGRAARDAATAAENARLDAQLEVAAKKAALRGLEQQAEAGAVTVPDVPLLPGARRTTIMIEKDGKTTILENPTDAQLAQVGLGTQGSPWNPLSRLESKQLFAGGILATFAIVGIIWMVLHYLRAGRAVEAPPDTAALDRRMARIENAVDAVAVEVERVSEAQRYTSRMLSEGVAQPVAHAAAGERAMQQNSER